MGEAIPCKIGTVPKVIFSIDRRTPMNVGRVIRIKERRGGTWQSVILTRVDEDGYFMADYL
jgi:hypothetical protein